MPLQYAVLSVNYEVSRGTSGHSVGGLFRLYSGPFMIAGAVLLS